MKRRFITAALLIFFMAGAFSAIVWSEDVPRITKDDLKARLDNPDLIILDVRAPQDWAEGDSKIKGAVREDPGAVKSWASKYAKDKTLVLY